MAIKPMLFNTEMVQAILESRKTVTRRIIKERGWTVTGTPKWTRDGEFWFDVCMNEKKPTARTSTCRKIVPPYSISDVIWVRETFQVDYLSNIPGKGRVRYKADGAYQDFSFEPERYDMMRRAQRKPGWRPNDNMPKEAARIFLRVTDVRAERLQGMSIENALSEGVPDEWPMSPVYCPHCKGEGLVGTNHPTTLGHMDVDCPYCKNTVTRFSNLWNSTIKPADQTTYAWEANPYVWVIEFERCKKPEGWPW